MIHFLKSTIFKLLLAVLIGILFSRKNNDTSDFYLGGRKLGPIVTAMSAEASDMSSWLLMGLPGLAYLSGIADAGWTAIGLAIGTYLNWKIVAKKIVAVSTKIVFVMRNLWSGGSKKLMSLYKTANSRSELVATFLAVLELCRANRVKIEGDAEDAGITLIKEHKRK